MNKETKDILKCADKIIKFCKIYLQNIISKKEKVITVKHINNNKLKNLVKKPINKDKCKMILHFRTIREVLMMHNA